MSVTKTRKHRIKVSSHLRCRTNKYRLSVKSRCNLSRCNQMKQEKQRGGDKIPVLNAVVSLQNKQLEKILNEMKFAFSKGTFHWTNRLEDKPDEPYETDYLANILTITRSTSQLEVHRDYTVKDMCELFTPQKGDITGLMKVFKDIAEQPAKEIIKKLNVPIETIDDVKLTLSTDECNVIDSVRQFLKNNKWRIPWVEKSTGRLLRNPLFEQDPLIDPTDLQLTFPIVVIQVQVKNKSADALSKRVVQKHLRNNIQDFVGRYKENKPILLSDAALTTLGRQPTTSASIRVHRSRANGQDDLRDIEVPSFGAEWLRQWKKDNKRFNHIYLQYAEHTEQFPLQQVKCHHNLISVHTKFYYSPHNHDEVYDYPSMDEGSISPSILDCYVNEGPVLYDFKKFEVFSCSSNNPNAISLYEYNRCVLPLELKVNSKDKAGGAKCAMRISKKKQEKQPPKMTRAMPISRNSNIKKPLPKTTRAISRKSKKTTRR